MLKTCLAGICLVLLCTVAFALDGQTRPTADEASLKAWLQNMSWYHRYSLEEMQQVTGLEKEELTEQLQKFNINESTRPNRPANQMFVLPYPGGRHPRIGFLDGAIEPQRETKLSVFCPWDNHSYAVVDVPEAIWSNLGLTYLAHTHIDTIWTKQGVELEQQEWQRLKDGTFLLKRVLPNGIEFGTIVRPQKTHVRMAMWLKNGTDEKLSELRVQNCVMLKAVSGFENQSNDNKLFSNGYATAHSMDETKWIITGWDPLHRAWGNSKCPCLHSDPKFPDCAPGETQWLRGWLSFYEGTEIHEELNRIQATNWRSEAIPLPEKTSEQN